MASSDVPFQELVQLNNVPVIDVARLQMREILAGRWRCCWNCKDWNHEGSYCVQFSTQPPTEVIIVGCSEWFASGIPF